MHLIHLTKYQSLASSTLNVLKTHEPTKLSNTMTHWGASIAHTRDGMADWELRLACEISKFKT